MKYSVEQERWWSALPHAVPILFGICSSIPWGIEAVQGTQWKTVLTFLSFTWALLNCQTGIFLCWRKSSFLFKTSMTHNSIENKENIAYASLGWLSVLPFQCSRGARVRGDLSLHPVALGVRFSPRRPARGGLPALVLSAGQLGTSCCSPPVAPPSVATSLIQEQFLNITKFT